MGMGVKCFEILENKPQQYDYQTGDAYIPSDGPGISGYAAIGEGDVTDDEEVDMDMEDEEDEDGNVGEAESEEELNDDFDADDDDDYFDEVDNGSKRAPRLRLREILFYDDKVAIFKARHGRL